MSDKIVDIPVKFKTPTSDDRMLKSVRFDKKCEHRGATFYVDETLEHVTCSLCAEKLNPMWVLTFLAQQETKFHLAREEYIRNMERLTSRQKTKCEHCKKMTRISHR